MGRNRYYLCARNLETNEIKTIGLSEYDIYGKGDTSDVFSNALEDIDYFTLDYSDASHIVMFLVDQGKLDSYDNELFIVSRKGEKYVFLENVYCFYDLSFHLKRLIEERKGMIEGYHFDNDKILDEFISRMRNDYRFRDFIKTKNHNIYNKFVDYFTDFDDSEELHQIKFRDSGWARLSYPLLRNIIEAMNRYDCINLADKVSEGSIHYQNILEKKRYSQHDDIMRKTDKEYDENQLSLFDSNDKTGTIDIEEFIDSLDLDTFDFDLDERKVMVNEKKFDCLKIEIEKLNCLNDKIKRLLYELSMYKLLHDDDIEYIDLIKETKKKIIKLIDDDPLIYNNFSAFIKQYNKLKGTDDNKQLKKEMYSN